jgi:hypothetical protein
MPTWTDVEIVTLGQAKQHAKITSDAANADLTLKLADAHAIVLDYVANGKDADYQDAMLIWDDETAPGAVRAAILRQFAELARFRGNDDDPSEVRVDGSRMAPRVKQLLNNYRTPSIA